MLPPVRVAAWTCQRALPSKLDRKGRLITCQNLSPRPDDSFHSAPHNQTPPTTTTNQESTLYQNDCRASADCAERPASPGLQQVTAGLPPQFAGSANERRLA